MTKYFVNQQAFLTRFIREKSIKTALSLRCAGGMTFGQIAGLCYMEMDYLPLILSEPLPKTDLVIASDLLVAQLNSAETGLLLHKLRNVPYVLWVVEVHEGELRRTPPDLAEYFKACQTVFSCSYNDLFFALLLADAEEFRLKERASVLEEFCRRVGEHSHVKLPPEQVRFAEPYVIEKTVGNARFSFIVANQQSKSWYDLSGDQPKRETTQVDVRTDIDFICANLIQPGDVVFDVGAHHGLYSMCFARAIGTHGSIHAFEPMPNCADVIRYNARLNGINALHVHEVALQADSGTILFNASAMCPEPDGDDGFDVTSLTLDDCTHKPNFIKINCGGCEIDVIRGAERVLERSPNLALRVHPNGLRRHGYTVNDLLTRVPWENYNCWYIEPSGIIAPWYRAIEINHETTIFAKSRRSAFKVVMLYDGERAPIGEIAAANAARYCERHGYELVKHTALIDEKLNGSWNKLKAVRQALDDTEWVFWLDCDALFVDQSYALTKFVSDYCDGKPMAISTDYNGICMGVFVIRNCAWARQLLDTLIFLGEGFAEKMTRYDAHNRWEQNTVKCLMDCFPIVVDNVARVPESVIQNPKSKFDKDAFIMHFWAGSSGKPAVARQKMEHVVHNGWTELAL